MLDSKSTAQPLEPELISTFRLLMALPAATTIFGPLTRYLITGTNFFLPGGASSIHLSLAEASVITLAVFGMIVVVYLSLPQLQQKMGKWYLPVAIFMAAAGPLIGTTFVIINLTTRLDSGQLPLAWPLPFIMIIPLSILAWQYQWRAAFLTIAALMLFELSICLLFGSQLSDKWNSYFEFIFSKDVIFAVICYLINRLVSGQRQQRAALTQANLQLRQQAVDLEQLATSRERVRVARELHDTLSHTMSGLILQLEGAQSLWEIDPERARKTVEKTLVTARNGLGETRRALNDLRSEPLIDLGLQEALRQLATGVAERSGLQLQLDLQEEWLHLSAEVNQALYRIAQESLTNIERHAQASLVQIKLSTDAEMITLRIQDNGDGFDPWQASDRKSYGIQGMRERVQLIGGEIDLTSRQGAGTVVRVTIHLPE